MEWVSVKDRLPYAEYGEALNFCNDCGQAIDWGE